jgi:adenylosuccinate synthase
MLDNFARRGKASFVLGAQFGSEGKGSAVAFLATKTDQQFDIVATNNGSQSGHTSIHDGVKRVTFHLPTYSLFRPCMTYLDAGAVIDPIVLLKELEENPQVLRNGFAIHPNAAIITQDCKDAEGRDDSAQTKIASTRKGVGEALARKVLRSGLIAEKIYGATNLSDAARMLRHVVERVDLNEAMQKHGKSVLVEIPQGHSLSIDSQFYPHTTSRNCTVGQAMSDAGIHPCYYHRSMLVIRTFPIRVGSIVKDIPHVLDGTDKPYQAELGHSGGHFPDQHEIGWDDLGVAAEITTVTKRTRRVFTFSEEQVRLAIAQTRPAVIFLTFCDYLPPLAANDKQVYTVDQSKRATAKVMVQRFREICNEVGSICNDGPEILTQWGPTTSDVIRAEEL